MACRKNFTGVCFLYEKKYKSVRRTHELKPKNRLEVICKRKQVLSLVDKTVCRTLREGVPTATTVCRMSTRTMMVTSSSISVTSRMTGMTTMPSSASATHMIFITPLRVVLCFIRETTFPSSEHTPDFVK